MKLVTKKAFTLIELLVVITIIGILATGATATYTNQIQKARDSNRLTDIRALSQAAEQSYGDRFEYPHADEFVTHVSPYIGSLPSDSKHGQPCNNAGGSDTPCAYAYITGNDVNGIAYGQYEISTAFENTGNVNNRSGDDGGDDNSRYEIGINIDTADTGWNSTVIGGGWITTANVWACAVGGTVAANETTLIVINWDPSAGNQCG